MEMSFKRKLFKSVELDKFHFVIGLVQTYFYHNNFIHIVKMQVVYYKFVQSNF